MSQQLTISIPGELLDRLAELVALRVGALEKTDSAQFATVEEAADYLGCSIDHIRTLYRRGDIRAFRPGRRILIDCSSLAEYIQSVPA